ncbi:MAG: hypothetical protein R3248_09905 [Candidatus Promineifilaceae bacterium]|nr:hypothetical protein [Candidatus Promineifilaceae bacterium]
MKRFSLLFIIALLALSIVACGTVRGDEPAAQPGDGLGNAGDAPTRDLDEPVSSDDPTATPVTGDVSEDVITGTAVINSVQIAIMESWPLQAQAQISGELGDGCTELGAIRSHREGDTFTITVETVRPAEAICTQQLKMFEESVPLEIEGLAAGTYTVDVNGVTETFTLDQDNVMEPVDEPAGDLLTSEDQPELIRLTLERALVDKEVPDYALLAEQGTFILSTEKVDPTLVPELEGVELTLMTPEEIQARANEEGDFLYLRFDEITAESADKVTVSFSNAWAVAEDSDTGYLSGGGFSIEYVREDGGWNGEITSVWIS